MKVLVFLSLFLMASGALAQAERGGYGEKVGNPVEPDIFLKVIREYELSYKCSGVNQDRLELFCASVNESYLDFFDIKEIHDSCCLLP